MPLPNSVFQTRETVDSVREYNSTEEIAPADIANFPEEHLNDDLRIPRNSLIRERVIFQSQYFPPGELIAVLADSKCEIYRVDFQVRRFVRTSLVISPREFIIREVPDGMYDVERYIEFCPGRPLRVLPYREALTLSPNTHNPPDDPNDLAFDRSEELARGIEGSDQNAPPPRIPAGSVQPPPTHPGQTPPPFAAPPERLPYLGGHAYSQRYDEGNLVIEKRPYYVLQPPFVIEGCTIRATYRLAYQVNYYSRTTGRRVRSETEAIEPAITVVVTYKIPGCEKNRSQPVADKGDS